MWGERRPQEDEAAAAPEDPPPATTEEKADNHKTQGETIMGLSREESRRLDAKIAGIPYKPPPPTAAEIKRAEDAAAARDAANQQREMADTADAGRRKNIEDHLATLSPEGRAAFLEKQRLSRMPAADQSEQRRAVQEVEANALANQPLTAEVVKIEGRQAVIKFDGGHRGHKPSDNGEFTMSADRFVVPVRPAPPTPDAPQGGANCGQMRPGDLRVGLRGELKIDTQVPTKGPHLDPAAWLFVCDAPNAPTDDDANQPDVTNNGGDAGQ